MLKQAQVRTIAVFLSGVVMGVAGIVFLGSGREQVTARAGQAAERQATPPADQKEVPPIGRYQAFRLEKDANTYAGLLDTATGQVWALHGVATTPVSWRWDRLAEGPK
jgi:hypothetical protein